MTDTPAPNTAAGDLQMPDAAPAPAPAMSYAEAASRKAEFFADKAKMDALMVGDVNATAEWRNIVNAISAQPPQPTAPREAATEHLNASAGYSLSADVLAEFAENRPVSPIERRFAEQKFEELKQDREWFVRYQRGEMAARKDMALINSILSRPIRDPQQS